MASFPPCLPPSQVSPGGQVGSAGLCGLELDPGLPLGPLLPHLENGSITPTSQDPVRVQQDRGYDATATVPDIVGTPKLGSLVLCPSLKVTSWGDLPAFPTFSILICIKSTVSPNPPLMGTFYSFY